MDLAGFSREGWDGGMPRFLGSGFFGRKKEAEFQPTHVSQGRSTPIISI